MSDEYYNTHWQQLAEQEEREYNIWLDEVNHTNREIENDRQRQEYIPEDIGRDGGVELCPKDDHESK